MTDGEQPPNAFERDKPGTPARDRAEAAIESLRQRGGIFVDAVRATRMAMVLTDPTLPGNPIVFANPAFLDLSGYSMDEVLGQQPYFLNGAGTDPEDAARFRQALERDEDTVIETVQYRKDGSRLLVAVFLSAFKDEDGRTLNQFLSYLDVTPRETAEDRLMASVLREAAATDREANLRFLLGTQAMWETNGEGVVVADSPSWRAYTGQTLEEWLGYGWLDAVHPDDRAYAERQWREAIAARAPVNADFRLRSPDGGWRWTNVRAVPLLDANGKVARWTGMNVDIDARKQAEAVLRESKERQAFLLRLSDAVRPLAEPVEVQMVALRFLAEHMDLSRAAYSEIHEEHDRARKVATYDRDLPPTPRDVRLSDFSADQLACYLDGRPFVVSDTETDERVAATREACRAIQVRAWVGVPVVKNGRLLTVLGVEKTPPHAWTDAEVELIQEVTERTWAASERSHVATALHESEGRHTFLLELNDAIRMLADPLELAEAVTVRLCERLGVDRVFYGEVEGDQLKVKQDSTRNVPSIVGEHSMESFGPDYLKAYKPCAVIRVDDIEQDARLTEGARAGLRERQVAAFADAVLFEDSGEVSLLAVQSATPRQWSDEEEALIRDVAERLRSAIRRVRTENALSASEERFRRFGEASQDVIWIRDAATLQWQYLTPAFEAIYGLSREKALAGDNYRSWFDLILPEDREHAAANMKRVGEGEHVAFEYRIRRPADGAIRHLRDTDFPIMNDKGEVKLIGGIGHDLTELRETELRLKALVEGIPQLVWRAGEPGHWTWASRQWTQFTGQSEEDSRGWGWLDPLHPDDRQKAREAWSRAVEQGQFQAEYRIGAHEAGTYRWFQTRATPVRNQTGEIIEWLGTSTDINDLLELQGRQSVLVAELQHRTRNLITVVNAVSRQTLKNVTTLDDFNRAFSDRLAALSRVQGLLSHLSAGERVTFEEVLRSELAALGTPDDKVTLEGPACAALKSATVQTLALALHELATNALKYGALASPGGHLTVRWNVISADDGSPRLQVDWRESGVVVTQVGEHPRSRGYGRELIERALPYQLGARTSYELTPDGVHCTVEVPISAMKA